MKTVKILMKILLLLVLLMGVTACSAHRFDIKDLDSFYATPAEIAVSDKELKAVSQPKFDPQFYALEDNFEDKAKNLVVKKNRKAKKETLKTIKLVVKKGTMIKDLLDLGVPKDIVKSHTHRITQGKFKGKDCLWAGDVITYTQTVA